MRYMILKLFNTPSSRALS
uniref:Uncharacterized protein n=1 Tax=Rhizophora mucronata TaxID=61149 RepID=A0A2P2N1B8_RHIMU